MPKLFEVVAVHGIAELRFLADCRLFVVFGIESPTVAPAHMEDAFVSVEIGADFVFFGMVAGIFFMFPNGGKGFEVVDGDLGVRRVGCGFFFVGNGGAEYGPATCGEDGLGIFFFRPPQHLIQPVNAPIAQRSVGVVEEVAPAAGREFAVVGAPRSGAAPLIPVHAAGRRRVGRGLLFSIRAAGDEHSDHSNAADFAGADEVHAGAMMRADAAMESHLDNAVAGLGGAQHGLAFGDGMAGGFFHKQMRARFQGGNGGQGVPVIGRGDNHNFRPQCRKHYLVVVERSRLVAVEVFHFVGGGLQRTAINVAEADDFATLGGYGFAHDVPAPPAAADERGAIAFCGVGAEGKEREGNRGGGCCFQKLAAIGSFPSGEGADLHSGFLFFVSQ